MTTGGTLLDGADVGTVHELHSELHRRRTEVQRIEGELDEVAGHLNAQHGRLVDIAVWLLAHPEEWSGEGVWTPQQYLTWRCGIGRPVADKVVALAERADELPETIASIRAGELSLDQAAPIAKRVPGWAEQRVVSLAKRLTVRQIQRTVAQYDFTLDPSRTDGDDTDDARAVGMPDAATESEPTHVDDDAAASTNDGPDAENEPTAVADDPDDVCWYGIGDDGRWRMYVETTRDVGDVVAAALDDARDTVFRRNSGDVSAIDALLEIAQRSIDAIDTPARRERHRINVHLHTDGVATDDRGVPLPDTLRRHLTCDGLVSPILVQGGVPVSVGRSERVVPERTRRVVLLRDGGCRVPGCDTVHHLEIHHVVHWSDGGGTDTPNLVALCPRHHRVHHRGHLGISGDADRPDGLVFTGAEGRPIRPSGAHPTRPLGPPSPITGRFRHPVGERLDPRYVDFHPPPAPVWRRSATG